MAYKISDSCVACGTCIDECPVEAISAGDIYVIDPSKCIDYVLGAGAQFVVKKSFSGIGCQASDHLPIYVDVEIKKQ